MYEFYKQKSDTLKLHYADCTGKLKQVITENQSLHVRIAELEQQLQAKTISTPTLISTPTTAPPVLETLQQQQFVPKTKPKPPSIPIPSKQQQAEQGTLSTTPTTTPTPIQDQSKSFFQSTTTAGMHIPKASKQQNITPPSTPPKNSPYLSTSQEEKDFEFALNMQMQELQQQQAQDLLVAQRLALEKDEQKNKLAAQQRAQQQQQRLQMRSRPNLLSPLPNQQPSFDNADYEELLALDDNNVKVGLPQEALAQLPCKHYNGLMAGETQCFICYDHYKVNEKLRVLPCFHSFHANCVDEWLSNSVKCPICTKDLREMMAQKKF